MFVSHLTANLKLLQIYKQYNGSEEKSVNEKRKVGYKILPWTLAESNRVLGNTYLYITQFV